ncbi:hypothetical protein Bbelb_241930 [Branchiostoma belcheri]|nr:hypothetical protein Bbelb_241930 [Branchiostoma belcheri]
MPEGCITLNASALWMVPTQCISGVSSPLIKVPGSRWLESGGPDQGVPGARGSRRRREGRGGRGTGLAAGTGRGDPVQRGRSPPSPEDQPVGGYEVREPVDPLQYGDRSHLTPTTSPSANFIGLDREGFRDPAGRVYITPDDQPSFCYPADQAATPSEGSQRSTTGLEGGRSFAPPSEVGRAKGAQRRACLRGGTAPGPRDPTATARPFRLRASTPCGLGGQRPGRPPYRRAGRESAGPFLTGRLGR